MRKVAVILADVPTEDIKALASAGLLRRNVVREMQAVAQYRNLTLVEGIKSEEAGRVVSEKHGMSIATFYRVLKIYAE